MEEKLTVQSPPSDAAPQAHASGDGHFVTACAAPRTYVAETTTVSKYVAARTHSTTCAPSCHAFHLDGCRCDIAFHAYTSKYGPSVPGSPSQLVHICTLYSVRYQKRSCATQLTICSLLLPAAAQILSTQTWHSGCSCHLLFDQPVAASPLPHRPAPAVAQYAAAAAPRHLLWVLCGLSRWQCWPLHVLLLQH